MNPPHLSGSRRGILIFVLLTTFLLLEFFGKFIESGVGHYLKWQNHKRPQLGRIWERDRLSLVAQSKIQSLRAYQDSQEKSAQAIESFRQLFENLQPAFPLVLSRRKFLELYYDFPGQWSERIISPYDLVALDARNIWERVIIKRFGPWITLGFLDSRNTPVHEVYISLNALEEVQATRTVKRGKLEEAGFSSQRVFSTAEFLPVLQRLDPNTQKAVFPDPRWFLAKNYRITRIGVSDAPTSVDPDKNIVFGIEYDTDYYTGVLLIPVPLETANNMLSQIEPAATESSGEELRGMEDIPGEVP